MSDDLVERLQLVANFCYAHSADTSAATCQEAAARIAALQAELAEAKAVPLVQLLKDYNEEEARAELAGLKDVGDEALVEELRTTICCGMACPSSGVCVNARCEDRACSKLATAVLAAIAPALIARERERAATECAAVANKHMERGNVLQADAACECRERIRAGAAP